MISWLDIPVLEITRAEIFYKMVFNIECQRQPSEVPSSLLTNNDTLCRICLIEHPHLKPNANGHIIYLQPNQSLNVASGFVERLGGKLLEKVTEIGTFGRRQIILDSEGNKLALFEPIETL